METTAENIKVERGSFVGINLAFDLRFLIKIEKDLERLGTMRPDDQIVSGLSAISKLFPDGIIIFGLQPSQRVTIMKWFLTNGLFLRLGIKPDRCLLFPTMIALQNFFHDQAPNCRSIISCSAKRLRMLASVNADRYLIKPGSETMVSDKGLLRGVIVTPSWRMLKHIIQLGGEPAVCSS